MKPDDIEKIQAASLITAEERDQIHACFGWAALSNEKIPAAQVKFPTEQIL